VVGLAWEAKAAIIRLGGELPHIGWVELRPEGLSGTSRDLAGWANRLPPHRNREAKNDDELIAAMAGAPGARLRISTRDA
jgi:hypothetical protein